MGFDLVAADGFLPRVDEDMLLGARHARRRPPLAHGILRSPLFSRVFSLGRWTQESMWTRPPRGTRQPWKRTLSARSALKCAQLGVSVEPDFDYSWLSAEPPGYEDVDDDGKVIEHQSD